MEYVVVDYAGGSRRVNMDGEMFGATNQLLPCPAGHHTFDLDLPVDYVPTFQNVNVMGTTPETPLQIVFVPREQAFMDAPPKPSAPPSAARKKR